MPGSFILNGIQAITPIKIGRLDCYELLLNCEYGRCKGILHGIMIGLLRNKKLVTYSLHKQSKDKTVAKIYILDSSLIESILERLEQRSIEAKIIERHSSVTPDYNAIENFFDLLVDVSISDAGFLYIRGKKGALDPNRDRYINKRTIIRIKTGENGTEEYYPVLYIDYSVVNNRTIADTILEELGIDDFAILSNNDSLRKRSIEIAASFTREGKYVLTLMKRGTRYVHVYGKIVGIKPVFSSEEKVYGDTSIYELWIKRFKEVDEVRKFIETPPSAWEYPLFVVEIMNSRFTYPPSLLRLIGSPTRHDPQSRWDYISKKMFIIEKGIKTIYKELTGDEIKFRYIRRETTDNRVGFRLNFYTNAKYEEKFKNRVVKLLYKDKNGENRRSRSSAIYAFSKQRLQPYAGKQSISLVVLYPSTIPLASVEIFIKELQKTFSLLNLGTIQSIQYYEYNYLYNNLSQTILSLKHELEKGLNSVKRNTHFPIIIALDYEQIYKKIKETASSLGFHSQIINIDTFHKLEELIVKLNDNTIPEKERIKLREELIYNLANICGGIYVEFLIQKSLFKGKLPGPLTWLLAEPADKKGETMYVGLDVSSKESVAGAAFIMFSPQGELIGAEKIPLKSELLDFNDYYNVFLEMIDKAKELELKRIVVMRDGIPKSPMELEDCIRAFEKASRELKYDIALDYVSVLKNTHVRVFYTTNREKMNPIQGTYIYLYKTKHFGFYAHEIAIVASKPKDEEGTSGGTTRPLIIRVYELKREYEINELKKIAEEYLALTRLNYWNLITSASSLPLPVRMADILAYLISMQIPIRVKPEQSRP